MSVRIQLWLGSFGMNSSVLLPLQQSMAQCGAGKHDQWQGDMAILVVNYRIINSISILTAVSRQMIIVDVGWIFGSLPLVFIVNAGCLVAALDSLCGGFGPCTPPLHLLLHENVKDCLPEGNEWIPNAQWWIKSGGDYKALPCCPILCEWNGI